MSCACLVGGAAVALTLSACASAHNPFSGWFGAAPNQPSAPAAAEAGQVYYSDIDGLEVHATATGSSEVIGRVGLHERVTRTRLEHGYAFVAVESSGLRGWVDNAHLIWRLPPEAAEPSPRPPTAAEPVERVAPTTTGATPTIEITAVISSPTPPPTATTTSTPATVPTRPYLEPRMFDPF